MFRCLDQITFFEKDEHGINPNPPVLSSRVVMEEDGQVRVYALRTAPTTEFDRAWLSPGKSFDDVPLHYATTLRNLSSGDDISMIHSDSHYRKDPTLEDKDLLHAVMDHVSWVNTLKRVGGWKTSKFMYDPTKE